MLQMVFFKNHWGNKIKMPGAQKEEEMGRKKSYRIERDLNRKVQIKFLCNSDFKDLVEN